MDPNENLKEQLRLAEIIIESQDGNTHLFAEELAELVLGLDHWLSCGGSLPDAWHRDR